MTRDDSPADEPDETPPTDEIDDAIREFVDDDRYRKRAAMFRNLDRWTGDDPVLLVVDAAGTTTGAGYFDSVKPAVERFRERYVETGEITTLHELADAETELQSIFTNRRKQTVAMELAAYFSARPEASDLEAMRTWAETAPLYPYTDDPISEISGIGQKTFLFLQMLAGADAIKPDRHVEKFVDSLRETLPSAPLEATDTEAVLESCEWLAAHSSFDLLELDQIAWWYFADVPPEIERKWDGDTDSESDGLRVLLETVDRDEVEVHRLGELRNGEVVQSDADGKSLERIVERVGERPIRGDGDVSDPVFWLRECRSFGSQLQRDRASVLHPAIDRKLLYPQCPLVGALRGLDADGSTYEDVLELDLTEPHLGRSPSRDGHTVTLRYELPQPSDGSLTREFVDERARPTAVNVIQGVVAATEYEHRINTVDVNTIEVYGYCYSQTVWKLRIDYDTAAAIDWETYDGSELPADSEQYTNLARADR
ncbi:hypothetical protein C477_15940 [Haloterrigena salina JCM 13891]|uniref:Uncharacterized protein n=1 Tax=Haloterrigena salina JCM 13891 TaxID=1227488 RepID=M0C1M0_9EURY|nr:hypothetical protein [Haloterrigena salina]ELZ16538.1 hypothetical protein C477_15940 [Haloterrigena salina JCM 13891]